MNKCQRVVLVLGAIVLMLVIIQAPRVQYQGNGRVFEGGTYSRYADVIDMRTALTEGIGVTTATILIFFAFKSNGKGKKIREESKKEIIADEPKQKMGYSKRIEKFFHLSNDRQND